MHILQHIFPIQCLVCKKIGHYLCADCKKTIKAHPEICPYCHKVSANYKTCLDCKMDKSNALDGIIIPLAYTNHIKKLILKLKYYHRYAVTDFLVQRMYLARLANSEIQRLTQSHRTVTTSIPSHRRRKYITKGYNQSELLAKAFAKSANIQYIPIARKSKSTKSQATLGRDQRKTNLKNAFDLIDPTQLTQYDTIIIIDDVTTTGSTINELAKIVKINYPKKSIRGMVVARHIG